MPSFLPLFIVIVTGIAFLSVMVLRINQGKKYTILLAICALAFASVALIFYNHFEQYLDYTLIDNRAIGAFWWLGLAYLCNALIKRFFYIHKLTVEGDSAIPLLLQHLVTLMIFLVAGMIITNFVYQQPITALAATSGAIAIVIGYSARNLMDEVVAGIAININSPFKVGDLVQINSEWGYIKDVNWRSVTYLDMDQNFVTLSNSNLVASKIRNLDYPTKLTRRLFEFRVEYNAPPKVVLKQLELAMAECPHIVDHPWNYVSILGADETGIEYRVAFHIKHYDFWFVASNELFNSIWYRFARLEIRWAHQRHLNYKDIDDERQGLLNTAYDKKKWNELIEHFSDFAIFDGMTREDMETIAKSARMHVVGEPERIIRAGSNHPSMFLIASGSADVYEVDDYGNENKIASIGAYEPIGMLSVLTGTEQRTTIRACEETVVWEISSASLHELFDRKPEIIEKMAERIAKWEAEDQALSQSKLSRQQEATIVKKRSISLARNIARFFNRKKIEGMEDSSSDFTDY